MSFVETRTNETRTYTPQELQEWFAKLEELRVRKNSLDNRKIKANTQLEEAQKHSNELIRKTQEEFNCSTVPELKTEYDRLSLANVKDIMRAIEQLDAQELEISRTEQQLASLNTALV